jgi:hypothetical protein
MTDTPSDDAGSDAAPEDPGSTAGSDGAVTPDLPGVTADDTDPMDQDTGTGSGAEDQEVGLGDGDDVQPGAGAVEPPD